MASSTFKVGDVVRYKPLCSVSRGYWGKRVKIITISADRRDVYVRLLDTVEFPGYRHCAGDEYYSSLYKFAKCDGLFDV